MVVSTVVGTGQPGLAEGHATDIPIDSPHSLVHFYSFRAFKSPSFCYLSATASLTYAFVASQTYNETSGQLVFCCADAVLGYSVHQRTVQLLTRLPRRQLPSTIV